MTHTHLLGIFTAVALLSGNATGQIVPTYVKPSRPDYRQAAEAFQSIQLLERVARSVNSSVKIPEKMPLLPQECGAVNAYYTPRSKTITLCYELLEHIFTGITKDFGNAPMEFKVEAAAGAMMFVLFHEVGHALSHTLNLPILGKEEDAADAIANYILLHTNNPTPGIIGSFWFFTNGATQPTIRDFADEHSGETR